MKTLAPRIILTLIVSFFISIINAQVSFPEIKAEKVIPPSPQMRAFQIYSDIPVSHTTGVPDISIPLYTLISGNIQIPIILRYHTHSVKPFDADRGNVALGWVVEYGGALTRTINGASDDGLQIINPAVSFNDNHETDYNYLSYITQSNLPTDTQSDWFRYSLPTGETAMFYLKRKAYEGSTFQDQFSYFLYPNTETVINTDLNFDFFKLTDNKGFIYELNTTEVTQTGDITAWMLNKVTDPFSGKNVNFYYDSYLDTDNNFGSFSSMLFDENPRGGFDAANILKNTEFYLHEGSGSCNHLHDPGVNYLEMHCMGAKSNNCVTPEVTGYHSNKITSISNGSETINFEYYGTSNKITKITISNGTLVIKEIIFNADNFPGNVTGRRLNSLVLKGKNGAPVETYNFEYYNGYWENYSCDYWGFYTGRYSSIGGACTQQRELSYTKLNGNQGSGYDFDIQGIIGQTATTTIGSSDFASNPLTCKGNLLEKVIYPTKGYSLFDYEAGKYIYGNSVNYGGGPRIMSITDYNENGIAKQRKFTYANGKIQNDPVTDISLYLTPKIIVKASDPIISSSYFITKQRVISNQIHWGANIDVFYPQVEILYNDGKNNFKEKYIYNSEHENTFNTIFQLDCPYFMPSKINNNPLRGKISRKEAYNSNDSLVLSEDYSYHVAERASIDNLVVLNQVGSALTFQNREILRSTIGGYFLLPNPMFVYKYYKISVPNSYLNSKTITNYSSDSNNVQTENFSNIYGSDVRIESHSTINSDNQETKINYTYIDSNINNDMYLNNMINMVRDTKYTKNNGTMMTRNDYNSLGLITKTSSAQGVGLLPSLESKIDYTYDLKGNISSASKTGGLPVCYIWGYEYTYPVV